MKRDATGMIRTVLIVSIMAAILCICIGMPAMAAGPGIGPQTVWSDQGKHGAVTGRVTTIDGNGIGGAYIAIVDAASVGHEYYNTTSDVYGNYQITGINATYSSVLSEGPNGLTGTDYVLGTNMYKMHAISSSGEGFSAAFGIDANQSAATTTAIVIYNPSPSPSGHGLQTVWSDQGLTGAVTGRVTTSFNGSVGIGGAYIALVDAQNIDKEYYNTTSDAYGNYQITGINATYSSTLGEGPDGTAGSYMAGLNSYKIYAKKAPYGEGWSAAFGIDASQTGTTTTSVVIFTKPANVKATSQKFFVKANGRDHTTITAYVTDALGNPVADGYEVTFHMANNRSGMGQFATADSIRPEGSDDVIVTAVNGYAKVEFGWMTRAATFNTITASWTDDPKVKGRTTIISIR